MQTLVFDTPDALKARIGEEIYVSEWIDVPQNRVDQFADATGDVTWIHVDTERAARESPFGGTVAHGMLTLTIASFSISCVVYPWSKAGAYYGIDRVRFLAPVPTGGRIRARGKLAAVAMVEQGVRVSWRVTTELEGSEKPVCVADIISLQFL